MGHSPFVSGTKSWHTLLVPQLLPGVRALYNRFQYEADRQLAVLPHRTPLDYVLTNALSHLMLRVSKY
jgi:hypothetical protein